MFGQTWPRDPSRSTGCVLLPGCSAGTTKSQRRSFRGHVLVLPDSRQHTQVSQAARFQVAAQDAAALFDALLTDQYLTTSTGSGRSLSPPEAVNKQIHT